MASPGPRDSQKRAHWAQNSSGPLPSGNVPSEQAQGDPAGHILPLQAPGLALPALLSSSSPYDTSQDGYQDWTFMSTHFWDENPKGIWTLQLENRGDDSNTGGCEPHFY